MSGMVSLFYSDSPGDFQAPSGLETLVRYPQVVLQAEMATATEDSAGRRYAEGRTPAAWLQARGCEVYGYINPFWMEDSRVFGGSGETFRQAQALQIEHVDAWLRTSPGGARVLADHGRQKWAVDVRNLAYQDWLRREVSALPIGGVFVDCGYYHTGSYHDGQGGPDAERAAIIANLYSYWRSQGKRLVINAGWEAVDPEIGKPVYSFAGYVDGVAIECPGGQDTLGKFWSVVSYRNVTGRPNLSRLERVVADWRQMGKAVWLVCRWQRSKPTEYTYSPFPTFEEHADFWIETAQRLDCDVAVFADNHHAIWEENWVARWGGTDGDEQRTVEERLTAIEKRLSALERAFAQDVYQ